MVDVADKSPSQICLVTHIHRHAINGLPILGDCWVWCTLGDGVHHLAHSESQPQEPRVILKGDDNAAREALSFFQRANALPTE
eukprot:scaffold56747_cov35-Tisochrysis_lutea.AAC.2